MNMKQLRALIDAGLTDEQIMNVIGSTKPGPKPEPEKDPKPEPEKEPEKNPEDDIQMKILAAITGLTETIQASNLAGAKNKEPESVEEMLEGLIKED